MMNNTDRLIEIIEDHSSMEQALRMILEASRTKELPNEGTLPCFNEAVVEDEVKAILEQVTGKEYD